MNDELLIKVPSDEFKRDESLEKINLIFQTNNSSRKLVEEVGYSIESPETRRTRMKSVSDTASWVKFVDSQEDEEISNDDFFAKTLIKYLTDLEDDDLIITIEKITQDIQANTPLYMYDISTPQEIIKSLKRLKDLDRENLPTIDLTNDAFRIVSVSNAVSAINHGFHRPSSHIPKAERQGTTDFMLEIDPEQEDVYRKFISEGHGDYVFYSSSSKGNIITQTEMYSQGGLPVVLWTSKEALSNSGVPQTAGEYNSYKGEVRLKGEVPVNIANLIFTDLENISQEDLAKLEQLTDVYDISILHLVNFVTSYNHYLIGRLDPTLSEVIDLPKGEFDIEPSHIIEVQQGLTTNDKIKNRIQSAQERIDN